MQRPFHLCCRTRKQQLETKSAARSKSWRRARKRRCDPGEPRKTCWHWALRCLYCDRFTPHICSPTPAPLQTGSAAAESALGSHPALSNQRHGNSAPVMSAGPAHVAFQASPPPRKAPAIPLATGSSLAATWNSNPGSPRSAASQVRLLDGRAWLRARPASLVLFQGSLAASSMLYVEPAPAVGVSLYQGPPSSVGCVYTCDPFVTPCLPAFRSDGLHS